MSLTYNKIIESSTEPSPSALWLDGNKLKYYQGGWKQLVGGSSNNRNQFIKLPKELKIRGYGEELGYYNIDVSELKNVIGLFSGCSNTKHIPYIKFGYHQDSFKSAFSNCTNLETIELKLEDSNITDLNRAFYNCSSIKGAEIEKLSFDKIQNFTETFEYCTSLENINLVCEQGEIFDSTFADCASLKVVRIRCPKATSLCHTFSNCPKLEEVYFDGTSNVSDMLRIFANCTNLKKVVDLDISSMSSFKQNLLAASSNNKLEFLRMLNLGKNKDCTYYYFDYLKQWGKGSEENRQSLVDTLLTYSFDRKAAGYPNAVLKFPSQYEYDNTWLTQEEKTAIKAKGYTIQ